MELNVRLSAKDLNTQGVFDALERLCLCFRPDDGKALTIAPPPSAAKAAKPPAKAAAKPQKTESAPVVEATVPATESAPVQSDGGTPHFEPDEIRAEIAGYAKRHGSAAAKALLASFGVAKFTELKPEQYAAVLARISISEGKNDG